MQTHTYNRWGLRLVTFSLAALAAASASYWILKWTATTTSGSTAELVFQAPAQVDAVVVARLLGGGQVAPAQAAGAPVNVASQFKLVGVVAGRSGGGYALISIGDAPAKPYQVGARIDDTLVLQSVAPRSAALAPGLDAPVSVKLELPPLAKP